MAAVPLPSRPTSATDVGRTAAASMPSGSGTDTRLPRGSTPPDTVNSSPNNDSAVASSMIDSSLTATPGPHSDDKVSQEDTIWVDFEPDDPENPFNFSDLRKYTITALAVIFTGSVAATSSAYTPGFPSMERDLNVTNHFLSVVGLAVYPLGFAIPPMVLAPFSEVFGRSNVYFVSFAAYLAFLLGTALSPNIASVIVFRFLTGAAGSTGSTLVSGTISDIFRTEQRGKPMALFSTAAIFSTGFGPAWSGWVEQNVKLEWRWIQWIMLIYNGLIFIILLFCLKETRGSVILTRRAARLRKETGDQRYRAKAEAERASLAVLIKDSLTRPLWLLVSEPIVISFSLWISWLWLAMYSLLLSIGLVARQHGYTPGQQGSLFWAISLAAILGQLTNGLQDYLYARYFPTKGPEARLYLSMIGGVLFPIGCFIYAWTSFPHVSIAGPVVGITILMLGVYHAYLGVFNFLADAYLIYASSALAAQSFSRNVFGFAAPLFTTQMYDALGYQWASSLVGFIGLLLGVVPFVLYAKGDVIRSKSQFSKQLQKLEEQGKRQQQERMETRLVGEEEEKRERNLA